MARIDVTVLKKIFQKVEITTSALTSMVILEYLEGKRMDNPLITQMLNDNNFFEFPPEITGHEKSKLQQITILIVKLSLILIGLRKLKGSELADQFSSTFAKYFEPLLISIPEIFQNIDLNAQMYLWDLAQQITLEPDFNSKQLMPGLTRQS